MKFKYIYLFVILVLGLLLSTFLGSYHSSSDSGIYYEGFSNLLSSNVFYSSTGEMITINSITDAGLTLTFSKDGKEMTETYTPFSTNENNNSFTGPEGSLVTLNTLSDEIQNLIVTNSNIPNMKVIFTQNKPKTSSSSNSSSNSSSFISDLMSNNSNMLSTTTSNYDNYNHYMGTSYPNKFYGPNGSTARIIQTGNETVIVGTGSDGKNAFFYLTNDPSKSNSHTFQGPDGLSATIITSVNGKHEIKFKDANGDVDIFTEDNIALSKSHDPSLNNNNNNYDLNYYDGSNSKTALALNGAQGNSSVILPTIVNAMSNNNNNRDYNSSLPIGIPASQIPPGEEDLYILKSQVVPPVCPSCPEPIVKCPNNFDPTKCPPCPPCARCPEPAFDCKKVPNYNAFNPEYLPVPVLNDFSGFGM